jgi:hypothetical protein
MVQAQTDYASSELALKDQPQKKFPENNKMLKKTKNHSPGGFLVF